ncbi:hypothetical protein ABEF93_001913 [Exophiala dermatitidis]
MGRFPWGQGQAKQGSDKIQSFTQDRLSKDNTENWRHGLNDLIREHSFGSGTSEGSPSHGKRSRTNTLASSTSFYARSTSDVSNGVTSRPPSRPGSRDSSSQAPERHDNPAKSLLSKGTRILRRQGSKLSLLPSPTEDKTIIVSDRRDGPVSPVKVLQRQFTSSSQRHGVKKSISTPFAFQHLSHGDQAHFQSLDNVTKVELFNAIQADQQPDQHVRGIPITDLPTQETESVAHVGTDEPTSPTTSAIPYLPITPPRPLPPPKNDGPVSPYSSSDIRLSRSTENFSRPTRVSMNSGDLPSPTTTISARLAALSPINRNVAPVKPLPQLPDVVHAVSTTDDIALPLRSAPLPSLPKEEPNAKKEGNTSQVLGQSTDITPSPLLDFPVPLSSVQRKRRSQSSGEINFDIAFCTAPSAVAGAEARALDNEEDDGNEISNNRISVGVKDIQLEDWENAIDFSWDYEAEIEEILGTSNLDVATDLCRASSAQHENFLLVGQRTVDEVSSSASTPLMMQGGYKPLNLEAKQPVSHHRYDSEPLSPLFGLGIEAVQEMSRVAYAGHDNRHVEQGVNHFDSTDVLRPNLARSTYSSMSKSSSQESIILSIASSIIGTHRSSNSSTSMSDLIHLANLGESLENLKPDVRGSRGPMENRAREGSQDTIREEHAGETNDATEAPATSVQQTETNGLHKHHDRGASAPLVYIPERKSSMLPGAGAETETPQIHGRKRAGTMNSRPRGNTRVSYSLFPTTSPR